MQLYLSIQSVSFRGPVTFLNKFPIVATTAQAIKNVATTLVTTFYNAGDPSHVYEWAVYKTTKHTDCNPIFHSSGWQE
jgi:hypothetical protein